MSSTCEDNVTEEGAFSIENILADFFLKKFDMPGNQSDKSDSNHYERRSKPKHKKHKKKSKHKHKKSKDHSVERESIYEKKEILNNSSSEEKEIKRLKKIKQLEGRSNKLWVPSSTTDIVSASTVEDIPNSKNCIEFNDDPIGIPYGPSMELLLTGVDSTNQECAEPVMGLDSVTIPVETVDSAIETNSRKAEVLNDTSNIVTCDEIIEKSPGHCASSVPSAESEGNSVTPVKEKALSSEEQPSKDLCKNDLQEQGDQNISHKKHSKSQNKHKSSKDRLRSRSRSKTHKNFKYESSSSRSRKVSYSESHVRRSSRSRSHSRNNCTRSKSRRYSRSRSKESRKKIKHSKSQISNKRQRLHSRSSEDEHLSKRDSSRSKEKYQHRSHAHRHRSRSRSEASCEKRKLSKKSEESFSRTSDSRRKSRSKSREKNPSPEHKKIDQAKILEVARKKLQSMIEKGTLPEGLSVQNINKEELASIKAGGKSVQELTDFCVRLSKKENEDVADGAGKTKDKEGGDEDDDDFIHHPFRLKEPSVLKLNIKNAVQIPIKTHAEKVAETARLSSQFPVSSGNQHKQKELEWVPVEPEKSKPNPKSNSTPVTTTLSAKEPNVQVSNPAVCEHTISEPAPPNVDLPLIPIPTETSATAISFATPAPVFQTTASPVPLPSSSNNCSAQFASPLFKPPKFLDITSVVTKRFKALTKLQEDPNDQAALNELQEAQTSIQEWVQSQQVPGQFTGSTDAKPLSVEELCGPKSFRFRKDIFAQAAPVTEGKGMSLLKKMGWNPGEGLGKNKEGSLEPLVLNIKTDKKGLVSEEDDPKKQTAMKELQGKHPVSALMELCSKRKWKPPLYTVVMDVGPPHKKLYLFKVEVNGVEYQPVNPCSNKKQAKAETAYLCLQALNAFPK